MLAIKGYWVSIFGDAPGRLVREKVCKIVWFGGKRGRDWLVSLGSVGVGVEETGAPTLAKRSLPNQGWDRLVSLGRTG